MCDSVNFRAPLKWKGGEPITSEEADQTATWSKPTCRVDRCPYWDLFEIYDLRVVAKVFPWAKITRAGIFLLCTDTPGIITTLYVKQRQSAQIVCARTGKKRIVPQRLGPPKGSAAATDKSLLGTAMRELTEETQIDLLCPVQNHAARIYPTAFVVKRPEIGILEMVVFFVAVISKRPQITLENRELVSFVWANLHDTELDTEFSAPARTVVRALRSAEFDCGQLRGTIPVPYRD